MKKFIINEKQFSKIMTDEESKRLYDYLVEQKFANSKGVLSIRFFMYYQNCIIYLPDEFEPKRKKIFKTLNRLGYTERDFMQSKVDFKKFPVGYKD